MDKKDYCVEVPFAGKVVIHVQASNKKEAKELAMNTAGSCYYLTPCEDEMPERTKACEVSWDVYERLVSGNVNHFWHNEIKIEECEFL